MKVCFCGRLFPDERDFYLDGSFLPIAPSNVCKREIKGLEAFYKQILYVISVPCVRYFPHYRRLLIHGGKWKHREAANDTCIGYANLLVIRIIMQFIGILYHMIKWVNSNKGEELIIYCYSIDAPIVAALSCVKRLFKNVTTCITIGDLPGKYGHEKRSPFFLTVSNITFYLCKKLVRRIDAFVLMTKFMASALEIENKPYVVVEGMYDEKKIAITNSKADEYIDRIRKGEWKGIALMAGNLNREFDIMDLLAMYDKEDMSEYLLLLAGEGDMTEIIQDYAEKHNNICYLGFVDKNDLVKLEACSTVLVNPRRNCHAYVKYSFPSKTIEGLASGKPYIGYKLDGIPREYDDFIQYPESESNDSFAACIRSVCSYSKEQRDEIAYCAKKFIKKNKLYDAQCAKIARFVDNAIQTKMGK